MLDFVLSPTTELLFPLHRRCITQYAEEEGVMQLRVYYGEKEISFDEPELFAFGECLARQSRFVAGSALDWGQGYAWTTLEGLFTQLLEEGVLQLATAGELEAPATRGGARPSLLPPAPAATPQTWASCAAITAELTGHELPLGYLEMVVPIFRVAHIALDAEGRQVGEGNVFPRALRVEVDTEWRTCPYPGSRYLSDRPMNITALKSMRAHWGQMMAALGIIRAAYLRRFPSAANGWTVGHLERLATVVLAVPTYALMRQQQPVDNGTLHPALASLFRVTDGLRMTMHQMLFVPIAEPTLSPDALLTSAEIFAYAERNYSFHSETGVCAGPQAMIEEFLAVVVDGASFKGADQVTLDPPLLQALADLDQAMDYALHGLQLYAVTFSIWPAMTRAYERLWSVLETPADAFSPAVHALRDHLEDKIERLKTQSYLAHESWRSDRERVYDDMYQQCGLALGCPSDAPRLAVAIAPFSTPDHAIFADQLRWLLQQRCAADPRSPSPVLESLLDCVMGFIVQVQAVLRAAAPVQYAINGLLGRVQPDRPMQASEIDIHNLLQGEETRRLPYLLSEIETLLGVSFGITKDTLTFNR